MGSLLISCFVIGKNELPPVHKENDNEENKYQGRLAILEKQRENLGLEIIAAPLVVQRSFQLIVKIFKGDGLNKLATGGEKYWVNVRT